MKNSAVTIILLLIFPIYSGAWGLQGHRVIGEIADHHLSAKARTAIKKILGNESIAMASNWGDFIKSDKTYDYLYPWHYINLPEKLSSAEFYDYLKKDTATDVYTKTQLLIEELKSKKLSMSKKAMYLKLLIHFIGDIHQPMHAARRSDKGGNDINVYWFNTPSNLHRVWDEQLVEFQQLSYTEYTKAIDHVSVSQIQQWQRQSLSFWIYESYQIAEKLYDGIKPEDKLSYNYNYLHINTVNRQLLKGGIRLAGMLNQIFG